LWKFVSHLVHYSSECTTSLTLARHPLQHHE
jgi:hypothetical protein